MPPKSSQGPKQTSLLGFFSKPTTTPTANRSRVAAAATPGSAAGSTNGSVGRTPASTNTDAAEKRRQAVRAAVSPTSGIKAVSTNATSNGKVLANGGGKTQGGKVDSDVFLGSSPLSAVDVLDDEEEERTAVEVAKSDGEAESMVKDRDGDVGMVAGIAEDKEEDEDEDDQPVRSSVSLQPFCNVCAIYSTSWCRCETQRGRSRTSKPTTKGAPIRTLPLSLGNGALLIPSYEQGFPATEIRSGEKDVEREEEDARGRR